MSSGRALPACGHPLRRAERRRRQVTRQQITQWIGATCVALASTGCGISVGIPVGVSGGGSGGSAGVSGPAIAGFVSAGTAAMAGARVQLYAAGTGGNGSAGTPLGSAVTTDAGGAFSLAAGSYTCPAATSVLYLVATGANAAAQWMTSPGTCASAAPSVTLNERTTAASVWALRPFLDNGAKLGSSSTNVAGLTLAVSTLASLIDLASGAAPGASFPTTGTAPTARINALANALHACIAARAACVPLFAATTVGGVAPSNTLDAALQVVSQPGVNVAAIFGLSRTSPVFLPALTAAPSDWTLPVTFKGGGLKQPTALSFDAGGQLWVANNGGGASLFTHLGAAIFPDGITGHGLQNSYGGAVDASGNFWVVNQQSDYAVNNGAGSITILAATGGAGAGTLTRAQSITVGGLNYPSAIAFDRMGVAWVTDLGNAHLTLLAADGSPQAGVAGYTGSSLSFPDAVAVDSRRNGWVGNMSLPSLAEWSASGTALGSFAVGSYQSAVAVDANDNVWTANYTENTAALVSASGTVESGAGFTGGGLGGPAGLAIDGAGTAWISNYGATGVTQLASAKSVQPGLALSPAAGWAPDAGIAAGFAVAIDAAGSVWVTSFANSTVTELIGAAMPVKTPLLGPVQSP